MRTRAVRNRASPTNPKRPRGKRLSSSLALRVGVRCREEPIGRNTYQARSTAVPSSPAGCRCGDELCPAMRKAAAEIGNHGKAPRRNEPGAIGPTGARRASPARRKTGTTASPLEIQCHGLETYVKQLFRAALLDLFAPSFRIAVMDRTNVVRRARACTSANWFLVDSRETLAEGGDPSV